VTFSPDGTELVFVAATFNPATGQFSHRRLMAVHAGGGTPIPLAESGVIGARYLTTHMSSPTWSPDGNWIAAWLDTGTALRLVTINTHNGRKAYAAPAHTQAWTVSWSPDASRLAYAATLRLGDHAQFSPATVDPDGSHRKVFWNRSSGLYYSGQAPAWSPDGSEVLFFAAHGEAGPAQLLAAAADGTGFMQIH
jgi:Tol biopolymer transport system component